MRQVAQVLWGEDEPNDDLADLLDDTDVLVAHRRGLVDGIDASVVPHFRPAYSGRGQADYRVHRLLYPWMLAPLVPDVVRGVDDGSLHAQSSSVMHLGRSSRPCRSASP